MTPTPPLNYSSRGYAASFDDLAMDDMQWKRRRRRRFFLVLCSVKNKFTSFYLYIIIIQNTHARARLLTKQQ
jgi:hypothetical protein